MRLTRDLGGGKFDILSVGTVKGRGCILMAWLCEATSLKNAALNRYGVLAAFGFWVSF